MTTLLVEGRLDAEILSALLPPAMSIIVEAGGTKWTLAAKARDRQERLRHGRVAYLRDRDFDFDPPASLAAPTLDRASDGRPQGWRWCRHEMENYLLEPELMEAALGLRRAEVQTALLDTGRSIQDYQAVRWVVGRARRALPPAWRLETRPDSLTREFQLPDSLDGGDLRDWAYDQLFSFHENVSAHTGRRAVERALQAIDEEWDGRLLAASDVLIWCSGKDLMAALEPWLRARGLDGPGELRARVRDWVREHPTATLALVPEWGALIELLRA